MAIIAAASPMQSCPTAAPGTFRRLSPAAATLILCFLGSWRYALGGSSSMVPAILDLRNCHIVKPANGVPFLRAFAVAPRDPNTAVSRLDDFVYGPGRRSLQLPQPALPE